MEELIREMEECLATMERVNSQVQKEKRGYKEEEKSEYERCKKRYGEIQEILRENKYLEDQKSLRDAFGSQGNDGSDGGGEEERSFSSLGEVASAAYSLVSQRGFRHEKRDLLVSTGPKGGYLVPDKQLEGILNVTPESSIIRPIAMVISGDPSSPDQKILIPALKTGAKGEFGGFTFEGLNDGVAPTNDNDLDFEQVELKPEEQVGTIKVSEALMRNAKGLDMFLRKTIGNAKSAVEDFMFINGNGAGQPTGILNSAALLTLSRGTTDLISYSDILSLISRQLDLSGCIFSLARSAMPTIMRLADDNKNNIFIGGDATKGIPDRLLGYPIKWTTHSPAMGVKGDIIFGNFKYYLIGDGTSFRIDVGYSGDDFTKRMVTLRALWDVDGDSWVKEPVKLMDGKTYSPFVTLDAGV